MLVRLNRWQPKQSRYKKQALSLSESKPVLDLLFNVGVAPAAMADASIDQKIMRTQHVDRISINEYDGSIDIFLSPIVERNYPAVRKGATKCRTAEQREVAQEVYRPATSEVPKDFMLSNPSVVSTGLNSSCHCSCIECQLDEHCKQGVCR